MAVRAKEHPPRFQSYLSPIQTRHDPAARLSLTTFNPTLVQFKPTSGGIRLRAPVFQSYLSPIQTLYGDARALHADMTFNPTLVQFKRIARLRRSTPKGRLSILP